MSKKLKRLKLRITVFFQTMQVRFFNVQMIFICFKIKRQIRMLKRLKKKTIYSIKNKGIGGNGGYKILCDINKELAYAKADLKEYQDILKKWHEREKSSRKKYKANKCVEEAI